MKLSLVYCFKLSPKGGCIYTQNLGGTLLVAVHLLHDVLDVSALNFGKCQTDIFSVYDINITVVDDAFR